MTRNKKNTLLFILFSAFIIGSLPLFNIVISDKKQLNSKFLYNTDKAESYRNYLAYKYLKYSFIEPKALVGQDGFLFLGNSYESVIDKVTGKYRPGTIEIESWTDRLLDVQKKYEALGIKFLFVIAPNKHSIYKEYLPAKLQNDGANLTDDIVIAAQQKSINLLDLRNNLKENKHNGLLYYKTDTHWNEKGAAIGFDSIIAHLNNQNGITISAPTYTLEKEPTIGGDLAGFLKIHTHLPSNFEYKYNYIFEKSYDICKGDIDKSNGKLEECLATNNPIIGINGHPQYTINQSAENSLNLLWLCDSFGTAPSQLYNSTFQTVWKWHWGHIQGNELNLFIHANTPDIVIYQVVERSLYNDIVINF